MNGNERGLNIFLDLAKLRATDSEQSWLPGQIDGVLKMVDKVKELDVTGVEPFDHTRGLVNVMRDDVAKPPLSQGQALAEAPEVKDGMFVVPGAIAEARPAKSKEDR